jgi:hypothetical protein
MWPLHERTKISLCRAAFVALCVAPTCMVALWCVAVRTPAFRRWHERTIAQRLGWQARIGAVHSPRPGTTLYEQVELVDGDSHQRLARLPYVEVHQSGGQLTIALPYPGTINGMRLDAFWRLACDALRQTSDWQIMHFEAQNLTLRLSDGDRTLTELSGQIEMRETLAQATLSFKSAGRDAKATATQLNVTRQRQPASPATIYHFNTGNRSLSCSLLAPFWPGVERTGKTCEFSGTVTAFEQSGRWRAEVKGRATGIDLSQLLSDFPHKLTGTAEAQLDSVRIEQGRIATAAGRLTAGPGYISRSLIEAAQANLQLQATLEAVEGPAVRPYDQLNLSFDANAEGLAVVGSAARQNGALVVDPQGRVLMERLDGQRVPVVNLVRTLVPQSAVQVPATRETAGLVGWLPVPSIAARDDGEPPVLKAGLLPAPLRH